MKTFFLFAKKHFSAGLLLLFVLAAFSFKTITGDPIAFLDHPDKAIFKKAELTAEDFKKSKGVTVHMKEEFEIARYYMVRVRKAADPVEVVVRSGEYNEQALGLVNAAASGDVYYFDKILAKSPALQKEEDWVKLNSLVIKIK